MAQTTLNIYASDQMFKSVTIMFCYPRNVLIASAASSCVLAEPFLEPYWVYSPGISVCACHVSRMLRLISARFRTWAW